MNRGRVYKIVNDVDDDIYIGSTTTKLGKRWSNHKAHAKIHPNRTIYSKMNSIGIEHFQIVLIERLRCDNKKILRDREQHYIELYQPTLNTYTAYTGIAINDDYDKQYHINNREHRIEQMKQYHIENRERRLKQMSKKCQCVCGRTYTYVNKIQHQKTRIHNKTVTTLNNMKDTIEQMRTECERATEQRNKDIEQFKKLVESFQ
jgi:hypothetical protein